ncbi:MAG: hypothetical protein CVV64_05450 [Candidatus Wallbacteria bacterium HGW-Wallbacteria-1]|uniref:Uncharacterized protein n=1 Tax=Candidatus Wallbacteria bacterium HGW-Wallbacteria-1 TaxID=2013854 RepID=A0A2N1PSA4_9BACT|nr:MAG: hypothetical protein CVV64_05450 [Candidatus Wallbacteria bacterium HGW-Wallbacteria-1]
MPLYTFRAKDGEKGCQKCSEGYSEVLQCGEKHFFCSECGSRVERVYEKFSISISDGTVSSDRLDELGLSVLRRKPDGTFSVKGRPLVENESLRPEEPSSGESDDSSCNGCNGSDCHGCSNH